MTTGCSDQLRALTLQRRRAAADSHDVRGHAPNIHGARHDPAASCVCLQHGPGDRETCRSHRLWWAPGEHGKAIIFDSGHVLTWPEGEGDHSQHAALRAQQTGERAVAFLHIRVDGTVRIPRRHAHRADELAARLTAVDRRLRPRIPAEHASSAGEDDRPLRNADRAQHAEWARWQRAGRARA
jgi:hypothetical protein